MKVQAIKTRRLKAGSISLTNLLDRYITNLSEGSILVITSKIVSLCENRVIDVVDIDKEKLVAEESDKYVSSLGKYGYHFTITKNTLISLAGIDESNGNGKYVLWPADVQATANKVRHYLKESFDIKCFGVIIVDSTSMPMRRGTFGIFLAHSGFNALNNYVGKPDLFGRPYDVSQASIAGGLAAAAVVVMGEGSESTPLCVVEEVNFVKFQNRDPTPDEIAESYISLEEDLYAPFLMAAPWEEGGKGHKYA